MNTQDITNLAKDFWLDWIQQEENLLQLQSVEIVEKGNELLSKYFPDVSLEIEGELDNSDGSKPVIVFTAHGNINYFLSVRTLAKYANSNLCDVRAFRSRSLGGDFCIGTEGFDLSSQEVRVKWFDDSELVGLELAFTKSIPDDMLEYAHNMSFIMLDHILGEWDFAVKVGGVTFVEHLPDTSPTLASFPPLFDEFWQTTLGHTSDYPQGEYEYAAYEVDENEEQDAILLIRNQSAISLVGHPDMVWCVILECPVDSQQELDAARELEDALFASINVQEKGIGVLSTMNMTQGIRTLYAYVSDAHWAHSQAELVLRELSYSPNITLKVDFDPSWYNYRL